MFVTSCIFCSFLPSSRLVAAVALRASSPSRVQRICIQRQGAAPSTIETKARGDALAEEVTRRLVQKSVVQCRLYDEQPRVVVLCCCATVFMVGPAEEILLYSNGSSKKKKKRNRSLPKLKIIA